MTTNEARFAALCELLSQCCDPYNTSRDARACIASMFDLYKKAANDVAARIVLLDFVVQHLDPHLTSALPDHKMFLGRLRNDFAAAFKRVTSGTSSNISADADRSSPNAGIGAGASDMTLLAAIAQFIERAGVPARALAVVKFGKPLLMALRRIQDKSVAASLAPMHEMIDEICALESQSTVAGLRSTVLKGTSRTRAVAASKGDTIKDSSAGSNREASVEAVVNENADVEPPKTLSAKRPPPSASQTDIIGAAGRRGLSDAPIKRLRSSKPTQSQFFKNLASAVKASSTQDDKASITHTPRGTNDTATKAAPVTANDEDESRKRQQQDDIETPSQSLAQIQSQVKSTQLQQSKNPSNSLSERSFLSVLSGMNKDTREAAEQNQNDEVETDSDRAASNEVHTGPVVDPAATAAAATATAKKRRRSVRWKSDTDLVQVRYIESSVRGTDVAGAKTPHKFGDARDLDRKEGLGMKQSWLDLEDENDPADDTDRGGGQLTKDLLFAREWQPPALLVFDLEFDADRAERHGGAHKPESLESEAQRQREAAEPATNYALLSDIPSTPKEPPRKERQPVYNGPKPLTIPLPSMDTGALA